MARALLYCLAVLLFVTGCAPKNPLDRTVRAGTPQEFAAWWDRAQHKFTKEERKEIHDLAMFLRSYTPRMKDGGDDSRSDPFCKRVDGLLVRDLMILAYRENNHLMRNRLVIESGKLAPLVNAASEATDERTRERGAVMLKYTRELIDGWTEKIERNSRRIAELEAPSP